LNEALKFGCTNGYSLESSKVKEIEDFVNKYKSREYKQTPLLDNFEKLCNHMSLASPEA